MAVPGPRGEEEKDARPGLARDGVALARAEGRERPHAAVNDVAAAPDLGLAFDDDEPGALAHLVVAQRLAGVQANRDRSSAVVRHQDSRIDGPARRLELGQVPGLHGCKPIAPDVAAGRRRVRTLAIVPPVVDQLPLGPLGTNCYVVRAGRSAPDAVVVDPSGTAAEIRLHLASLGARCAAILVTHGHFDHVLGLADLAEGTGAPVHAPAGERLLLEHPGQFTPPGIAIRGWSPDVLLEGGEALDLAAIRLDVLAVPGHSPAHLAYAIEGGLLAGDVLFAGSVGRVDLPGGDWETLLASLRRLVDGYPADTVVYPGHGPSTRLGDELARNPFLAELRRERQEAGG